jgi:hypothetical protein
MRRFRITAGLAVAALALAVAAPALAKENPKAFYGEFTASIPGQEISPTHKALAKGKGEVDTLRIGPLELECETNSGFTLNAKGEVEAERSPNFTVDMKISGCKTDFPFGKGGNFEPTKVSFGKGLKMEFHANGSAAIGNPAGEVKILETAPVTVKARGRKCKIFIRPQVLPTADEKNPEGEFEAAEYGTEKELLEAKELKKFPSGVRERLEIFWELKKIKAYVPIEPGKCEYVKGTEGKFEPEGEGLPNRTEYTSGLFEGEVEEVEIKHGELGFDTTPPEV